ncbi:helix-turn-helix domain-containing protein [Streptococcus equi]|uniref:helix-turn-helix domain-containing protein n=1 Tax=Streptococcus equi TaxID=1336 RepID=UPI001E3BEC03|nr:helix-turn-helix domain-containing protein [Streptococcus equi]
MIENHLEHTIIDKHNLINLLYKTPRLALIEASQSTNLSTLQIKKYLEELSDLFQEEVSIVIDKGIILCHFNKPCKDFYSFEVYRQSNVLQLLKFLIKNDTSSKSLSSFAKKHFLSSSGTYRLRTALTPLLKEFGLKLSKIQLSERNIGLGISSPCYSPNLALISITYPPRIRWSFVSFYFSAQPIYSCPIPCLNRFFLQCPTSPVVEAP